MDLKTSFFKREFSGADVITLLSDGKGKLTLRVNNSIIASTTHALSRPDISEPIVARFDLLALFEAGCDETAIDTRTQWEKYHVKDCTCRLSVTLPDGEILVGSA